MNLNIMMSSIVLCKVYIYITVVILQTAYEGHSLGKIHPSSARASENMKTCRQIIDVKECSRADLSCYETSSEYNEKLFWHGYKFNKLTGGQIFISLSKNVSFHPEVGGRKSADVEP